MHLLILAIITGIGAIGPSPPHLAWPNYTSSVEAEGRGELGTHAGFIDVP
jgi:hypothetical protein